MCDDGADCQGPWVCDPLLGPFLLARDRLWVRGEYLMWWGKSASLPPLATTSTAGTAVDQAGVLGQPGTSILFGGDTVNPGMHSGGRFTLGSWLDPCQSTGVEVTYMFLGNRAATFNQSSQDDPILARPLFNMRDALQDAVIVAYPGQQTGSLDIQSANELDSVEVLVRHVVFQRCDRQMDFLAGYRYGRFAEDLAIDHSTTYVTRVQDIPLGTVIAVSDRFAASNEFHGAELGVVTKARYCNWSLELLTKLALGNTRSRVSVNGSTVVTERNQAPATYTSGMLALPTNAGNYERDGFSVIPELGVTVGYNVTCRLKATVGYTFLYWSQVVRPGDQVDTNVNPTQFPPRQLVGVPAPQFGLATTDFWAQGLNIGLDYRF
jgi:hypothetical protein